MVNTRIFQGFFYSLKKMKQNSYFYVFLPIICHFCVVKVFNRKGGSEMTVCNVVIMKEVIELIRQSDYFGDGELNFDLKLQKTADF